MPAAVI
jgi:hypothetical protein